MQYVKHFDSNKDKNKMIHSMILSIRESINDVLDDFDDNNPNWGKILKTLDEAEAKMLYVLNNANDQLNKKEKNNL